MGPHRAAVIRASHLTVDRDLVYYVVTVPIVSMAGITRPPADTQALADAPCASFASQSIASARVFFATSRRPVTWTMPRRITD